MWVFLALGAAALTSFNPILYKRMLKDADPIILVWSVTLLALPLLGLFTLTLTPRRPSFDGYFVFGLLGSAGLNVFAHLASTRALQLEEASLVTPLLTFSPVFTALISAIFLGEIPSAPGWIGIIFVLFGAYWLNYQPGTGWFSPVQALAVKPGVLLVLLAGLLWAITPLFEKVAIQHTQPQSPHVVAFAATALLTLMLTPPVFMRGQIALIKLSLHRRELVFAGLIAAIAPLLAYTAYSLGFVGYVTTLFKMSTVMTIIWSSLLLKERGVGQRLPSASVMVIGVIILASSGNAGA